ncbi:hypothetical protein RUM43_002282 [Polyplax serrata]|uniref:Vacuolar protein sorting-associated protein 11 homolog n=1 Tax=Polyplax serrata TaxID=468196 RepID=A0AAN8PM56_POLSC
MAIHELRRFTFFDLNTDCDNGSVKELLKDSKLKLVTSGHGNFIFCDNEGNSHILNRNFKGTLFRTYAVTTTLAEFVKYSPLLVTIGEDEVGVNPILKVWNTEKLDKSGNPTCLRVTRLNSILSKLSGGQKAVQPSCLCIHEGSNLLAVGFYDGSILLFRGDITRDRSSKPKLLRDTGSSLTGLAFRTFSKYTFLFVSTEEQVLFYDVSVKDKELKVELDNIGCQLNCSLMAESSQGANFVVARNDAVYCYTTDGKGPCYAVEGVKVLIQWSKMYLVIISKEETSSNAFLTASRDSSASENHEVTILDMQNKLIVFSTVMKPVLAVIVEWGSFFIITKDHKVHHLVEKNVQSKLALLFKKNRYDVAIRMAKSQHYDEEGLVDIFRQYGDHLYAKGDRFGAIEQYIKTIGKLEPSYIIRRFMESAHMEQLMEYLEALHKAGLADEDHTTLLLNCYIKLGRTTDLKNFIMIKDRELDFDIDIALKVVRGVNPEDALQLAKTHGKYEWVLRIMLEDQKKFGEAIHYIKTLDTSEVTKCFMEFGDTLITNVPKETTEFLKLFCTEAKYKVKNSDPFEDGYSAPKPEDYLHLFLNKSEFLVDFLEHLIHTQSGWSKQIYNALVEHHLVVWSKASDENRSLAEQRLMKLLQNPDAMYHQVLQYHLFQGDHKAVLATCKRYGHQDPSLWIQALWSVARQTDAPSQLLSDILAFIEKEKLLSPLLTVEALGDAPATLGQVRKYLMTVLEAEDELLAKESELIDKYTAETQKVKVHIKDLQTNTTIFQGSRCSICTHQLELPSIHFLCQHSYHQHCFQSYSENENECIVCKRNNKQLLDMIKYQEQNHELHESFHSQLEKADDGFSVVADYFGRGVFNTLTILPPEGSTSVPSIAKGKPDYVKGTEAVFAGHDVSRGLQIKSYDTTRHDFMERIESNMTKIEPKPQIRAVSEVSSVTPACSNPFDDEYDETKNPFAEDLDSTNPFTSKEEFDYDEHKNPFARSK